MFADCAQCQRRVAFGIFQNSGVTVQYSTVQYSTVQYSTVQYSTVQYSTAQYSTVQYSTVQSLSLMFNAQNIGSYYNRQG